MNGAGGERSEADGVSGAMSPEATSRGVVGRFARGKVLKTDARTSSTHRRSASSSAAPEVDGVKRGLQALLRELTAAVRSTALESRVEASAVSRTRGAAGSGSL